MLKTPTLIGFPELEIFKKTSKTLAEKHERNISNAKARSQSQSSLNNSKESKGIESLRGYTQEDREDYWPGELF